MNTGWTVLFIGLTVAAGLMIRKDMREGSFLPRGSWNRPGKNFWLGLLVVVMGIVAVSIGATNWLRGEASRHWPSVPGIVTRNDVQWQWNQGSKARGGQYLDRIAYRYEIEGIARTGSEIQFGGIGFRNLQEAEQFAHRYPVGATVPVRYDPLHPTRAILLPGHSADASVMFAVGWVFILVGGRFLVVALKAGPPGQA